MKLLDKILLRRYTDKESDDYILARNLSLILLSLWIFMAALSIRFYTKSQIGIATGIFCIFITVSLALVLVMFNKIDIATPLTLIGINILSSAAVFSLIDYHLFEVYMITTFQLTILVISTLITYKQFYAYLMVIIGIITIGFQFFFRGIKLDRALILANYEDYIIVLVLLFLTGFILGKIITQKKRIMSQLKENEEKYSTVVNSSSEGIIIHQGGLIKFVNEAAAKLIGKTVQNELLNKPITNFVQIDQRQMIQERMEARMAGGDISELLNVKLIHKDGSALDVEVKRTDIIFQGEKSILLFLRDITHRKKLQETLIQSEKMLSLGGLAAGMAHEINNPLAGIMQNAQVISNRLEKDSPANIKSAEDLGIDLIAMRSFLKERKIFNQLDRIREAGARAAEIVSNMLSFARKEQNRSSHDVRKLLDKTIEMAGSDYNLKKKYDFRSIKIIREYQEDIPMVICDPGQLQQVFFNILKNGAEAMQEKEKRERRKETGDRGEEAQFILVARQKEKMVRIEIENNLCGIPEELQGRIFEPFYTTKPVGVGTGLGLSVSYFIIHETHRGELRVESDGESWVKFIIELPYN